MLRGGRARGFTDVLNVVPIEDNDTLLLEQPLPDRLPEEHPVTETLTAGPRKT